MIRAATLLMALGYLSSTPAIAAPGEAGDVAAKVRTSNCQNCHGPQGDSANAAVPRLNGQSSRYIYARLHSMRYPLNEAPRAIHNMGDFAPELQSQVIAELANYYAGQTPAPSHPSSKNASEGERIYKQGAGTAIPACQNCHGANGEGHGTAPRLAGQHTEYLLLQLRGFAMAARIAKPMNKHVWTMTDDQMRAVAGYLGG